MTRRALLLTPALALGAPLPAGRWRSVTTTRGGIGAVYEFSANGRGLYASAALVKERYTFADNQLSIGASRFGVGWHPDGRMQFNDGAGHLEDFTPAPGNAPNSLIGEWSTTRVMAGQSIPVLYQFSPSGVAQLILRLRTCPARLLPAGSAWRITVTGLPTRTLNILTPGELITITVPGGDAHQFIPY